MIAGGAGGGSLPGDRSVVAGHLLTGPPGLGVLPQGLAEGLFNNCRSGAHTPALIELLNELPGDGDVEGAAIPVRSSWLHDMPWTECGIKYSHFLT